MNWYFPKDRILNPSMSQQVLADLRMRIISNGISKGTMLSENKLSEEYGVSRSPIRAALRDLEKEDLLQLKRMGAEVIGISKKGIDEIYDVRLLIESFVVKRLLGTDNSSLLRELQKILEMMKIAVKYHDADEFSFKDVAFHEAIILSIQHRYIEIVWNNVKPIVECLVLLDMRKRMEHDYNDFERIIDNHDLYIKAIAQKDEALIETVFYKNFNDVKERPDGLWKSAKK